MLLRFEFMDNNEEENLYLLVDQFIVGLSVNMGSSYKKKNTYNTD